MKIFKTLSKRGLALFLVLTMCVSLLPATALAAEAAEALHTHNEDGWACVEESQLICGYEQEHTHDETCWAASEKTLACSLEEAEGHQHDESCYTEETTLACGQEESEEHSHDETCYVTETVLSCGQEEAEGHTHGEDCFAAGETVLTCELEEHQHGEACYASVWTCTEPSEDVSRFLRAVKAIPEEITAENVEEAEVKIAEAIVAYQHLGGAEKSNASVVRAYDVILAAEIAVEAAKEAVVFEEPTKDDAALAPNASANGIPKDAVALDPAALVEANYDEEGFVTLYEFFALVSQSGWMEGTVPYGEFVPALELVGELETFHLDFDPEVMQEDDSTPIQLTRTAVYFNDQAVTVYTGFETESLPEGMDPELLQWVNGYDLDLTAFFYVLQPGMVYADSVSNQDNWFYLGTGSFKTSIAPSSGSLRSVDDIVTYPNTTYQSYKEPGYPTLAVKDGDETYTYTYSEDRTPGTYYIEWKDAPLSNGAGTAANTNDGGWQAVVPDNILTWHVNGVAKIVDTERFNVAFEIMQPGDTYFTTAGEGTELIVEKDAQVPVNAVPKTPDKLGLDKLTYHFVGWYDNEACEGNMVNFANYPITQDTTFYGKYVAEETYTVRYDLAGGTVATSTQLVHSNLANGAETPTIADPTKIGYTFNGWEPEVADTVTKDVTYVAQWTADSYGYTVEYYFDGTKATTGNFAPKPGTAEFQQNILTAAQITVENTVTYDSKSYVLESVDSRDKTVTADAANNVVKVYYAVDVIGPEGPDNIPDKYQREVTYKVDKGGWNDKTGAAAKADVTEVVTLKTNGELDVNGTAVLNAPAVGSNPDTGYKAGSWAPALPATFTKTSPVEYTYTYVKNSYGYTVEYYFDGTKATTGNFAPKPGTAEFQQNILTAAQVTVEHTVTYDGKSYVLERVDSLDKTVTESAENNVVEVYYAVDVIGPEGPDNIPDKYQVTFQFEAEANGVLAEGTPAKLVKTLTDNEGKYVPSGTASIEAADNVKAKANTGYKFDKWTSDDFGNQSWTSNPLTTDSLSVTGGQTYTFTAAFKSLDFKVVLDPNGGMWPDGLNMEGYEEQDAGTASKFVTADHIIGKSYPSPEKVGYNFIGWKVEGVKKVEGVQNADSMTYFPMTIVDLWKAVGEPDNNTITLTAQWEAKKLTYTTVQHFRTARDETVEDVHTITLKGDMNIAVYGTPIADLITGLETAQSYDGQQYAYVEGETKPVLSENPTLTINGTQIDLYYYLDTWKDNGDGPDSDKEPDGTPDVDQVLIRYVVDPAEGGTLSVVTQVETLDNGTVTAKNAVTPNSGYKFAGWTGKGISATSPAAGKPELNHVFEATGGSEYTFTARLQRELTVSADDVTAYYDGQPHGITVNVTGAEKYTVKYYKDAGHTQEISNEPVNVADSGTIYFVVTAEDGRYASGSALVTIKPVALTAAAKEQTKVYDGEAFDADDLRAGWYTITAQDAGVIGETAAAKAAKFIENLEVEASITSSCINAGTYQNAIAFAGIDAQLNGNYTLTQAPADLLITPKPLYVTVTGKTSTVPYNGEEQTVSGYDLVVKDGEGENAADVLDIPFKNVTAEAKGTNVGTYVMDLKATDFMLESENYTIDGIKVTDGKLTITPAVVEVTITGNHSEKVFNGIEQKETDFTSNAPAYVTVALASGAAAEAKGTNVGTYNMGLTEESFTVTSNDPNYTAVIKSVVDGWLKIVPTAIEVTVTGKTNTVTYNGQEQQVEGFETDAPAGVDVKLKTGKTAVAKGTNPATYPMGLSAEDFDVTSSNYVVTIKVVDGWLIIDSLPYNPVVPPITPPPGGGGGTTIPDGPTPLVPDPGTTIADQDVPLAAPGLNNTDHFDYIKGYVIDGQILVRPEANITRAEVATIFFRLMTKEFREANWATENDFTDVKKGDWYNNAISTCTKAGILKGYEDGTFKPNQTISREEFAAIAARFASEEVPAGGMFKDIAGRWSEKDIERAAAMGWIKGSNGLFRPVDKITRAEVIVIVNRMLDRVPDADHMLPDMKTFADNTPDMWWYADVQEATNSHEYDRAEDGVTGIWTSLLPEQDWAALEEEWATAADANVADVAPKLGTEGEKPEEGAKEPETAGGSDGNGEE